MSPRKRDKTVLLFLVMVSVCVCQIVNGAENMSDLERHLEIKDQVARGEGSRVR